jgi:hypothetical protein
MGSIKKLRLEPENYSVLSFDSQIEVYSGGVEYVGSITFCKETQWQIFVHKVLLLI